MRRRQLWLLVVASGCLIHPALGAVGILLWVAGAGWRDLKPTASFIGLSLAGWAVAATIAIPFVITVHAGQLRSGVAATLAIVMFLAVVAFLPRAVRLQSLGAVAKAWMLGGIVSALIGTVQALADSGAAHGLYFHKNLYGNVMLIALVGAFGFAGQVRQQWLPRLAVVVIAIGLLLSRSEGAYLGSLGGLSVLALNGSPRLRRRFSWGFFALAILVGLVGCVYVPVQHRLQGSDEIANGSFEYGTLGWHFGPDARIVRAHSARGSHAVALAHARPGWGLSLISDPIHATRARGGTLRMRVLVPGDAARGTVIQVAAIDRGGRTVGYLRDSEWRSQSELLGFLPRGTLGEWKTLVWHVPPLPDRAAALRIIIAQTGTEASFLGPAGYVDDFTFRAAGTKPLGREAAAPPPLRTVLSALVRSGNLDARVAAWRRAVSASLKRPWLGYGFDGWKRVTRDSPVVVGGETITHSHSFYLWLWLDGGLFFALAAVAFLVLQAVRLLRSAGDGLAVAAGSAVVGTLIANVFDRLLVYGAVALPLAVLLGIAGARVGEVTYRPPTSQGDDVQS